MTCELYPHLQADRTSRNSALFFTQTFDALIVTLWWLSLKWRSDVLR